MKRVKRITIILGLALLFVIGGLVGLAHVFKDEIIAKVLAAVNENVEVPIDIAKVDFSLIHHFPKASVLFEDVFIADRFDQKDTLLYADLVSLEFDIWDLIHKEYIIDKISVAEGRLKMRTLADGEVNYIFWKEREDSNASTTLAIDRLELNQVLFSYHDDMASLDLHSDIRAAEMYGLFDEGWMRMVLKLEGRDTDIQLNGLQYLQGNEITFEGSLDVDEKGHDLIFQECVATVGKVKTPLSGRIFKTDEWNLDLVLDGSLEIEDLLTELPQDQKGNLLSYGLQGTVDFLMSIKGESSEKNNPVVDLAFDLRSGELKLDKAATAIRKIRSKGRYIRDEKGVDRVQFADFEGKMPQGVIAYKGLIKNFDRPYIDGEFSCRSTFADIISLVDQQVIKDMKGAVDVSLKVKGNIPVGRLDMKSMQRLDLQGRAALKEVAFELGGNGYICADINTELILKDDQLIFESMSLLMNEDRVNIQGDVKGLWPYLLTEDGMMTLTSKVDAPSIHWDRWAQAGQGDKGSPATLPADIELHIDFAVGQIDYRSFEAAEVTGRLDMKDRQIDLSALKLKSCNGNLSASLHMDQQEDLGWVIASKADIQQVDIDELFKQFDQFGQSFLTDKQLKGKGSASINFRGDFDPNMELDLKSLVTDADISIKKGELIEHKTMVDMIDALRERQLLKTFVRADELEQQMHHIYFSTLENRIHIKDGLIHIPSMRIDNSSMEIGIAGMHSFNNEIDYSVDFDLRDVLINKSNPDFIVEDDGLGHVIHLRMTGTTDNPIITLDKERNKEDRKEAITQAKEDVKDFFNDPFRAQKDELDERSTVKVVFEENENGPTSDPLVKNEPTKTKTKRWKLLDDTSNEPETSPDDEDDF